MREEKISAHIEPSKDLSVAHKRSHFTYLLDFATDQESHELVTMGTAKIPALGVTFFKYSFAVSLKTHRSMRVHSSICKEHEHVNKLFKECSRLSREFSSFFGEISEAFKSFFRESSPT